MKSVEVLIERDKLGRLHGYVLQRRDDGYVDRGDDMLKKRVFRDVSSARIECDRIIRALFIMFDVPPINYTFPADWKE